MNLMNLMTEGEKEKRAVGRENKIERLLGCILGNWGNSSNKVGIARQGHVFARKEAQDIHVQVLADQDCRRVTCALMKMSFELGQE